MALSVSEQTGKGSSMKKEEELGGGGGQGKRERRGRRERFGRPQAIDSISLNRLYMLSAIDSEKQQFSQAALDCPSDPQLSPTFSIYIQEGPLYIYSQDGGKQ